MERSVAHYGIKSAGRPVCVVTTSAVVDTVTAKCYCKWGMCQSRIKNPTFKFWCLFAQFHRSIWKYVLLYERTFKVSWLQRCITCTCYYIFYNKYTKLGSSLVLWTDRIWVSLCRIFRNLKKILSLPIEYLSQILMQNFLYYCGKYLRKWSFIPIPRPNGIIWGFETTSFAPKQTLLYKKECLPERISIWLIFFLFCVKRN